MTFRHPMRSNDAMVWVPGSTSSLMVRTDFTDPGAWDRLQSILLSENGEGFRAYVEFIDEHANDGATWRELRDATRATSAHASVLFIADHSAHVEPDNPIQVVDLSIESRQPFRCIARELWAIDNNLNLANMDWEEFAALTGPDGIYRGLPG